MIMLISQLNSSSKLRIIQVLSILSNPVCFRDIVSLTDVGIRSAQIALKDFEKAKLIKKTKSKNMVLYQLIPSEQLRELQNYFQSERKLKIEKTAKNYQKKAINLIKSLQDLYDFGLQLDKVKNQIN